MKPLSKLERTVSLLMITVMLWSGEHWLAVLTFGVNAWHCQPPLVIWNQRSIQ